MADRKVRIVLDAVVGPAQAKLSAFGKQVTETADGLTKAGKDADKTRQSWDQLAGSAGKVGLAAAGGLGLVTKAAMDWESAWAGVTKTVDGTSSQMAELEEGLRGLAKELPATHAEIAGVAEAAGQLGVAREDILSFTRTMIDLSETTNLTADEAATSIAQMANVMGTSGADIDNLGSALVALGNDGASTERQIIQMAQRISGAGAQIGLAEADILAIANAAASMGIEVEAGGTAISRVFTDMAKATAQGSEDLDRFARAAGVSAEDFATAFRTSPAKAFEMFTQGLDRINKSGGDVFTTLDNLGLADVRVSRALLGMAASGDLLSDSLRLGSQAWEENTALAVEAAKRYDTAASQTQVAWNNVKDAAIEFGEGALPVLEAAASTVSTLANAVGSLPGPVKGAATSLAGITAVLGGGLWFGTKVVRAVTDTRDALSNLSGTAGKTGTALSKVGRGASVAAAGLGALAIIDALQVGFDKAGPGVEAMTKSLLSLKDASELPKELNGVADAVDRLANPNKAQALQDNLSDALGFGGGSELKEARGLIEDIDAGLVSIATSAGPAAATDALQSLAEAYGMTKGQVKDLKSVLPGYKEALAAAENDTTLAALAQDKLTGAMQGTGPASQAATEKQKKLAEALKEAREEARGQAQEWLKFGDSLDDADVSLDGFIKSMEEQAKALENFTANAQKAANRGLRQGLIDALEEAGPAGARRMAQLANATDAELKRANRAWRRGREAMADYENFQVKDKKPKVDTGPANKNIKNLRDNLDSIRPPRLEITANTEPALQAARTARAIIDGMTASIDVGGAIGSVFGSADGSTVPKDGGPYADRYLYALAPGEEVISNRHGQADRHRALLKAINAGALADGGTAVAGLARGGTSKKNPYMYGEALRANIGFNINRNMEVRQVIAELAEFRRAVREAGGDWTKQMANLTRQTRVTSQALNRQRDALEESRATLKSLREDAAQYRGQVSGTFNNEVFGSGLGAAMRTLRRDRDDARDMLAAVQGATRLGLSGEAAKALYASGDLSTARQLDTKAEVREFQKLFEQRIKAQNALGGFASGQVFGDAIREQSKLVSAQTAAFRRMANRLDRLENRLERVNFTLVDKDGRVQARMKGHAQKATKAATKHQALSGR